MPSTIGGLVRFAFTAVLMAGVGIYIINRVGFLNRVVYGKAA